MSDRDQMWQIGSVKPPTICLCCGQKFDEKSRKMRGPYLSGPYIWVCQWCWRKPFLFFPDKNVKTCGHTTRDHCKCIMKIDDYFGVSGK